VGLALIPGCQGRRILDLPDLDCGVRSLDPWYSAGLCPHAVIFRQPGYTPWLPA
jgi:hypothetical protein